MSIKEILGVDRIKPFSILCVGVFLCGCRVANSPGDVKKGQTIYLKKLEQVRDVGRDTSKTTSEEFSLATLYLEVISGIPSEAGYSSTFGYSSNNQYKAELAKYEQWFKKNKCRLTQYYIDSAFKRLGIIPQ